MPPVIDEFWASDSARWHMLDDHGVLLEEALEAVGSTPRHRCTYAGQTDEPRYVVPGKTGDGKRLWVVFADEGNGWGRVITAYEPSGERDRARHRRMRGD